MKSKFYNFDSFGPDWTKKESESVIHFLETLPRKKLLEVARKFEVRFPSHDLENITDKEIIDVILSDFSKDEILKNLQEKKKEI